MSKHKHIAKDFFSIPLERFTQELMDMTITEILVLCAPAADDEKVVEIGTRIVYALDDMRKNNPANMATITCGVLNYLLATFEARQYEDKTVQ